MDILQKIISQSGGRVLSGPFKNMLLDSGAISWGDGDVSRKLLGVYEEELHPDLEATIARRPERVVNLGCAEGYYAVGISMRLQGIDVIAVDISPAARRCTAINSSLNGASVNIADAPPDPKPGDFWMIDIEGGEVGALSDPVRWKGVEFMVELHEWTNRGMKDIFQHAFQKTHEIKIINQGGRNPNKFDFLSSFSDHVRWAAMSESRPEVMRWMWMRPVNKA
jgi:hypothetical protein